MAQVTLGAPGDPKSLRSLPDASRMAFSQGLDQVLDQALDQVPDQVLVFILDIDVVSIKHIQKIHPPETNKILHN